PVSSLCPHPPSSTPFPYTTLFRSPVQKVHAPVRGRPLITALPAAQGLEVLHRHRVGPPRGLTEGGPAHPTHAGSTLEVEVATDLLDGTPIGLVDTEGGRDDVPVVVLGQGQQPVHLLHLRTGHTDVGGKGLVALTSEVDPAHVGAHRRQATQDQAHRLGVPGGEQL